MGLCEPPGDCAPWVSPADGRPSHTPWTGCPLTHGDLGHSPAQARSFLGLDLELAAWQPRPAVPHPGLSPQVPASLTQHCPVLGLQACSAALTPRPCSPSCQSPCGPGRGPPLCSADVEGRGSRPKCHGQGGASPSHRRETPPVPRGRFSSRPGLGQWCCRTTGTHTHTCTHMYTLSFLHTHTTSTRMLAHSESHRPSLKVWGQRRCLTCGNGAS